MGLLLRLPFLSNSMKKKWIVLCSFILVICGVAIASKLAPMASFWKTSRISWVDQDPDIGADGKAHVPVDVLEFGVVRQLDDPRFMGDSCVLGIVKVKSGEKVVLQPILSGLPPGTYSVHVRATSVDGFSKGKWSDPHTVYIDFVEPKTPSDVQPK